MLMPGKYISWKDFFKEVKNEYTTDKVSDIAGSVTYFAVLAIFPFLLFLVTLAGLLIEPQQAQALIQQMGKVAPPDVTGIFSGFIQGIAQSKSAGLLTISILGALWTASGGMVALMKAFNTAYDVEESRPFWKVRGIAIGATLGSAVLLLIAVGAVLAIPALAHFLGGPFEVLRWLRLPIAGLVAMFLLACLYYFLPNAEQRFHFITFGSSVAVLLWLVASWGFSVYVQNFGKYQATYGALGGVIVMLLWMWISSQVVLLGAEMNAVLEHTSPEGKRAGAKTMAETGPSAAKGEERAGGLRAPHGGRPVREERPRRAPALSPALAEGGERAWKRRIVERQHAAASPRPASRGRVGSRKKKVSKLELAMMGWVAVRSLRRGGRGRPPQTVH